MKKIILLGICIFVPFIGGCNPSGPEFASFLSNGGHSGEFVLYRVTFNANGPPPMQTLFTTGNCTKGPAPRHGCVQFSKGAWGVIIFGLVGVADNLKCNGAVPNWVITKIELSDTGDIGTGKGTNFGSAVATWVQDAFSGVDPSTGVLYDEKWNDAYTSIGVVNSNNNDVTAGPKDLWYQVTATKCKEDPITHTHATNTSDPRVENMGR
ncbi:MAG: hypothetical protein IID60_02545 [Proteobacteria bacterium]|nr:hypothetical protein [Pseudomonadota bacterium]